jgi:hypothetical protein
MKVPNVFKIIWWIILLIIASSVLWFRYKAITNGTYVSADVFIFLIWTILMMLPIVNEVNFFGIGIKKEVDELKNEVNNKIGDLKNEIRNTIDFKTNINPNIYLTPPTDAQIPKLLEELIELRKEKPSNSKEIENDEIDVNEDNVYLFKVRFKIENELKRIYRQCCIDKIFENKIGIEPTTMILRRLSEVGMIDMKIEKIIREILGVCNYGIHNMDISLKQLEFAKEAFPETIKYLKDIN